MTSTLQVLIVGREPASVRGVEALLTGQPGLVTSVRILGASAGSVLASGANAAQVMVLCHEDGAQGDLESLAAVPPSERPALVLCGRLDSPELARLAVRCGAADLLPPSPSRTELLEALRHAGRQPLRQDAPRDPGSIIAILGAAGGVGASFIASNLAFLTVQKEGRSALLIDMDLQYAPLTGYLGIRPEIGLPKALERVETLDRAALGGYVGRHISGVGIMAGASGQDIDAGPLPAAQFQQLLELVALQSDRVLVDTPRWLDEAASVAVLQARHIVLVLQQTVGNVQNASRLYRLLTRQLGIPKERIVVVLNRFARRSAVETVDVERALACEDIIEMPNDYEMVRSSLDAAVPLSERRSTIGKSLEVLSSRIGGPPVESGGSFLSRALPKFRRGDA